MFFTVLPKFFLKPNRSFTFKINSDVHDSFIGPTLLFLKNKCTSAPKLKCWSVHYIFFSHTGCPTRYRNRHFINNFTTNEGNATTSWHVLEVATICIQTGLNPSVQISLHIFIGVRITKEIPGSVASGTSYTYRASSYYQSFLSTNWCTIELS
jgi:hypothetical protein